ncbi:A24 family peptidase [Pasteurella multocida]|uniref:A24 family peptidase n=1 Tax=Pasteurella multocida TaxID=747 RepID=UPI0009A0D9D6|nr:prepilin peptidase [Pasteurella multocida]MCL7776689.1 prepilin peptidase [Pasteurella multocida]MCL8063574.1 prepilin peptidase [Pasteurella multocida]MCL8066514.1 prepilin peptidase [Pasteurella multocida]MCW4598411.1 prepilin peptidase [Pasteurella multocida subsp. multocida]MDY0625680.1 prepilin peptidase [Pasteurella multocida]
MLILFNILLVLLLIRLSWTDLTKRVISNNTVLLLLAVIIPFSFIHHSQIFFLPALLFLFWGFLLFTLGVIGAGDIKLIAVLMLSIPTEQLISFFFLTSCSGLMLIIIGWLFFRESIKKRGLPYGIAISLGFLMNWSLFS